MPVGLPTIPETITVHLGDPDAPAPNVTLPFSEYILNVASSEIYPTWPEEAIRANIYAQISFALNRIYTEYYRSRGYDFDITNSTRYDQYFVNGREIFSNIREIGSEIFNDYIRRQGDIAPLFAQYCNGTTVTCPGLS
ncbi:MAG: SpoIID/LytB domain-containing protein, partial [Clostridia bacterium]|nr:SpoIID/LytB domain-containing protein [Clostridia bacterium]